MSTTWIAVANASIARIYLNHGPNKGLQLVKELAHPESREKGADLVSDRPGHNAGAGNGHGSFVPATDPKQNEAEHFALELAKELEHGRTTNSYQRLILVLSTPFMGMVKQRLSSHANSLVTDTIEKDYTRATEKELAGHLAHSIFL